MHFSVAARPFLLSSASFCLIDQHHRLHHLDNPRPLWHQHSFAKSQITQYRTVRAHTPHSCTLSTLLRQPFGRPLQPARPNATQPITSLELASSGPIRKPTVPDLIARLRPKMTLMGCPHPGLLSVPSRRRRHIYRRGDIGARGGRTPPVLFEDEKRP